MLTVDESDFPALEPEWNALTARMSAGLVFLEHDWFSAAWQWRRRDCELAALCCRRDGRLVAALPLVGARRRWAGTAIRELRFLTVPDTQHCDFIADDPDANGCASALASYLCRRAHDWDVMSLDYLGDHSRTLSALKPELERAGLHCVTLSAPGNPYVALDTSWQAYYATRSRSLKKANNLAANRLRKAGNVEVRWLEPGTGDAADVARAIASVTELSSRSWKSATGTSLDQEAPQAFLRELSLRAHARGWLSIWTLTLDESPVAMEYQLVDKGNVYALRSDFDAALEQSLSPGSYLNRHIIEQLFGRGLKRYYMGPGRNAYKQRWQDGADPVLQLRVYANSLRAQALRAWERGLKPVARKLRDHAHAAVGRGAHEGRAEAMPPK